MRPISSSSTSILSLNTASFDCFASLARSLFRVFSTESLWISAIVPASVEDETTSDNICAKAPIIAIRREHVVDVDVDSDSSGHEKESITRSIAGCSRFLTLTQCEERRPPTAGRVLREPRLQHVRSGGLEVSADRFAT